MKNGGWYSGFWYRRKPHGEGEYSFLDSSRYVGDVIVFLYEILVVKWLC